MPHLAAVRCMLSTHMTFDVLLLYSGRLVLTETLKHQFLRLYRLLNCCFKCDLCRLVWFDFKILFNVRVNIRVIDE